MDNRDFYIFGKPIKTKFGKVRFLTYREYLENISELTLMTQNVLHLYYLYKNQIKNIDEQTKEVLENFKKSDLLSIILQDQSMLFSYLKIFQMIITLNEGIEYTDIIKDKEGFLQIRQLIMDMNLLNEEEVSPNEEIQKGIEARKKVMNIKSEKQSFTDIVTSIVASTSNSFEDVCDMTVYQVYAIYARIGAIFNYQTTSLFATVAKVDIEPWNKHLDLFAKDNDGTISRDEFDRKFGKSFL